ncbi:metalloregulator ArsR/SmtB family transcription factor [Nocardioides sp.]|uniref:ArsR/SmtB family transcription factor n=1 Tax=Nocardioides sp. TaxID=35761 RepID=UPI002EDB5BB2
MTATTTEPQAGAPSLTVSGCCAPAASGVADDSAQALAAMFKALADPARVKIVSMLLNADEVCACDVSALIGKSAATTSHHLKLLRAAGLVRSERRGTWVYYTVVPERLQAIAAAVQPVPGR